MSMMASSMVPFSTNPYLVSLLETTITSGCVSLIALLIDSRASG
jgi:hypothetical protein